MQTFSLIQGQAGTSRQTGRDADSPYDDRARQVSNIDRVQFLADSKTRRDRIQSTSTVGEFFRSLSTAALRDFDSIAEPFSIPEATILFREGQEPSGVLFLVKGKVKLSINSIDGGRLILGTSVPGEILGLTSAVLGCPYDMTAEAMFPCMISSVHRKHFLDFLIDYPKSSRNVARELSIDSKRKCELLRTLGLKMTAPAKLARLLLDWSMKTEREGPGAQIHCSFTHEEIGEHIGLSRETVSRCLADLKSRGLVEQHRALWVVPDPNALAIHAGILLIPSLPRPAA